MQALNPRRRRVRPRQAAFLPLGALLCAVLPLAGVGQPAQAAGVDPLPAVARALAHVTSYQVTITTTTSNGRPRTGRPRSGAFPTPRAGQRGGRGGGFGFRPGTQTLTAVRKSGGFEDYIVSRGKDFSGKTVTSQQIVY